MRVSKEEQAKETVSENSVCTLMSSVVPRYGRIWKAYDCNLTLNTRASPLRCKWAACVLTSRLLFADAHPLRANAEYERLRARPAILFSESWTCLSRSLPHSGYTPTPIHADVRCSPVRKGYRRRIFQAKNIPDTIRFRYFTGIRRFAQAAGIRHFSIVDLGENGCWSTVHQANVRCAWYSVPFNFVCNRSVSLQHSLEAAQL